MVMLGSGNGTFQSPVSYSTPYSVAYPKFAIGGLNSDHKSPRVAGPQIKHGVSTLHEDLVD